MKKLLLIFSIFFSTYLNAEIDLRFFTKKAFENNIKLNAERKNLESAKQNKNISRSEFLPSITLSGSQISTTSSNRKDKDGASLSDTNLDTETKTISLEQKIFSGFKGVNTFKKSELETEKANLEYKQSEQQTILEVAKVYFDLIYKSKSKKFNFSNVSLFERQVEFDSIRLQKGEITLTDLAQSESSLAGANASLIKANTEFVTSERNFERVTGEKSPDPDNLLTNFLLDLPSSLNSSQEVTNLKNLDLLITKLEYEIAKKDLNIEKSRLSPSASINISKTESKDFSSTVDNQDDEKIKATITWPIIKGGENISSIKKSSFDKQRALLILQDKKNKISIDTANFWSNYKSSKSVLQAVKAQLKAAEIANEGITLEYDSGNTRSTLEVIQSRSLLLEARIAHAKAERDFIVSQFELAKQIGSLTLNLVK